MSKVKSCAWVAGIGLAMILALSGCGSNAALLAERSRTEAEQLQDACRRTALANEETKQADGYLTASAAHLKDGQEEVAQRESDLASILYRLALARRELAETQAAVDALKTSLAKDQDQLQTYQQVLEEVKAKRKP
jgi:chromosome segregation ATPase